MISATDNPFCASISLFSSTKLQPIFLASILPRVDLPAPRKPIRAMPANDIRRCAEAPLAWPERTSLACAIWFGVALRSRSRSTGQSSAGSVAGIRSSRCAAIAFGNAGNFCQHLSRHAAERAHGADALAQLLEKQGFGIFGHIPCSVLAANMRVPET